MDFFKSPKLKNPKIKTSIPRGTLPTKRDLQKSTNIMNKRIREPIPAAKKKEVIERAKGTCEWPRCKQSKYLEINHKNMKNDDNRLSNLVLLCPNHHTEYHDKYKRHVEKDLTGREISSKVVTKEQKKNMKKKSPLDVEIPKFELPEFGGY